MAASTTSEGAPPASPAPGGGPATDPQGAPGAPGPRRKRKRSGPERALALGASGCAFFPFFSIALTQIALGLTLLIWIYIVARKGLPERLVLKIPLLLWAGATLIVTLSALDVPLAFEAINDAVWIFGLWPLAEAARDPRTRASMARLLVLGGVVTSLIAIGQGFQRGFAYRIHGTLPHYMTFSGVLLFAIVTASARGLFVNPRSATRWVAIGIMGAAMMWTQTRSAWLGVAAGLAFLAMLRDKRLVFVLPLVAGAIYALAPDPVQVRIESFVDFSDDTFVERRFLWSAGFDVFQDHPLTGVGPDNLRPVYADYKLPGDPWPEHRRFTHLHQNALQIMAERGIIGLSAWIVLVVSAAVACARRYRTLPPGSREPRALAAGALAAWIGNQVAGVFEYNFGDSEVATLGWVVLAMALVSGPQPVENAPDREMESLE